MSGLRQRKRRFWCEVSEIFRDFAIRRKDNANRAQDGRARSGRFAEMLPILSKIAVGMGWNLAQSSQLWLGAIFPVVPMDGVGSMAQNRNVRSAQ